MAQTSPARAQQSYRHEAFLWHDADDFTAGLVPFIEDGLNADEPVMVAVIPEHTAWLRERLGTQAESVTFVDMVELAGNPARIIPAWQKFLDASPDPQRPARGVGEPIWPGRSTDELVECQLHEALLNVAVHPKIPLWLLCPYDAAQLSAEVVEEAHRSHPVIVEANAYHGSSHYAGRAHVDSIFGAELSQPTGDLFTMTFTADNLNRLLAYVRLELYVAGIPAERASELALVIRRLALGSLRRGAVQGGVRLWSSAAAVLCEVSDAVAIDDPLLGRRWPAEDEDDGLYLANQLCDLVQLRSTRSGTAVRVHTWK